MSPRVIIECEGCGEKLPRSAAVIKMKRHFCSQSCYFMVCGKCYCGQCGNRTAHAKPDWDDGSPWDVLAFNNSAEKEFWQPHWMDHLYQKRDQYGEWMYIAEPYHLDSISPRDLEVMVNAGYAIQIDAYGRHNRDTYRICISHG